MLDKLFKDAKAILIGGKLVKLFHYLLENVVPLLFLESRDYFFKHMVAFFVFSKVANIVVL